MDGIEKAELQRENGTREIVEEVDRLRLTFGFDKVQVLTPFVETRLRSGGLPVRALKVGIVINDDMCGSLSSISMEITMQIRYPQVPPSVDFVVKTEPNETNKTDVFTELRGELLDECALLLSYEAPTRPVELVQHCMQMVKAKLPQSSEDDNTAPDTAQNEEAPTEPTQYTYETEETTSIIAPSMEPYATNTKLCCKICSTALFDGRLLHSHSQRNPGEHRCTSYFLEEAPAWLPTDVPEVDKIYCTKCKTRVGSWSWVGSTCSCDTWIVPSFQFTKSKLDVKVI